MESSNVSVSAQELGGISSPGEQMKIILSEDEAGEMGVSFLFVL